MPKITRNQTFRRIRAGVFAGLVCLGAAVWPCASQETKTDEAFDKQSMTLRTALHYDPSLEAPLQSLVRLYEKADRIDELIGLYKSHVAQYPADAGAKAVLINILRQLNRAEVDELIQGAAREHPGDPLIQHLLYQVLYRRNDPRALNVLSKAIDLETRPARRETWIEELLEGAVENDARELAVEQLNQLQSAEGHTAESLLALAERMERYGFHEQAVSVLERAAKMDPSPETGVEITVQSAKVQAVLGRRMEAGKQLDDLLGRLAPDHWRRSEIMSLRVNLMASDAERERMLSEARSRYEKSPENESAVLEYAEMLAASELRRDAVKVLTEAAGALPHSERIEGAAIELLERLGDEKGLANFLENRLALAPDRADFRFRLAKVSYLLGKSGEAERHLETVLEASEPEERGKRLLELARYLRRMSLHRQAAGIFQRVVDEEPARFDIRRELAEVHLASEDRNLARAVLTNLPVKDAAIENLFDLAQFMLQEEFLIEARDLLEARLKIEPENFDLGLQLVKVLGKTGDRARAEALLSEARGLTDTPSRYGQWLEVAIGLYEQFDEAGLFFDNEQLRYFAAEGEESDWTADRIEKFLALCEIGERSDLEDRVTQALRNQLASPGLPGELKTRLRQLLVKALERSPEHAAEVEQQLQILAEEDGTHADEYRLRRGLLYHSLQRPDLAQEALAGVNARRVGAVGVLKAAFPVFLEYDLLEPAKHCLESVTRLDPSDLGNWERRMSLLAALGEESELRRVIRQLLVGVDRVSLSGESLQALRLHLFDSYWREIAEKISDGGEPALTEVLTMTDALERESLPRADRLWALWARACALGALGRTGSRDDAIEQLIRQAAPAEETGGEKAAVISFPDGLSIALDAAVGLLRGETSGQAAAEEKPAVEGPLSPGEMGWGFEVDHGARVIQMTPVEGGLLVLDDAGTLYRVDAQTGKLQWRERFGTPEAVDSPGPAGLAATGGGGLTISNSFYQVRQSGTSISVQQLMAPYQSATLGPGGAGPAGANVSTVQKVRQFACDEARETVFLPFGDLLQAVSAADGALRWTAEIAPSNLVRNAGLEPGSARPGLSVAVEGDRVLTFSPASASAACFDAASGKLIWMRQFLRGEEDAAAAAGDVVNLFSLNTGAAFAPGRIFLFGERSLILDSSNGEVIWSFESRGVRTFPVRLSEKAEADADEESDLPALPATATNLAVGYLDHLSAVAAGAPVVKPFLQYRGALVAPAVRWSAERVSGQSPAWGAFANRGLLLMGGEGLRRISLEMPLASQPAAVDGVFVGQAGSQAWFVSGAMLRRADLETGQVFLALPREVAGEYGVRAVLQGNRVYVIGSGGLLILNAHTGEQITRSAWPKDYIEYREKYGDGFAEAKNEPFQYFWQGIVKPATGLPAMCFPIADRVSRDALYTLINDSCIVAIRGAGPAS